LLEEESSHFIEVADLARSWGDLLKEANLLEKAGYFREAMEEICNTVKSLAKMEYVNFYDFACSELKVMSDQHNGLPELKKYLHASRKSGSSRGEIFLIRKILDAHFHLHFTKYEWEDKLPTDITEHRDKIFKNKVSVRTLVFYWNMWKENVVDIFFGYFHSVEPDKHHRHLVSL
nr:UvrD-like helicase, ATP-binding domain, P-loop containing nucleoside triphosphate hydrolase [Tanacetum cinerariifolium]